jgi:hypothetical protein
MSESDKTGGNPDKTIQLDALDQASLDEMGLPQDIAAEAPVAGARKTPPPLPPEAFVPSGAPAALGTSHAPSAAPRGAGKTLLYAGVFLMLLAVAIGGGLAVGTCARGKLAAAPPATTGSSSPAGSVATAPSVVESTAPAASASVRTLTLPPIEIK